MGRKQNCLTIVTEAPAGLDLFDIPNTLAANAGELDELIKRMVRKRNELHHPFKVLYLVEFRAHRI